MTVTAQPRATLDARLARPPARGIDALTTLEHFAMVSYLVPLDRLRPHVDPQFEVVPFRDRGQTCGLVSVVPFVDVDFPFAALPLLRFRFAQTNYRLYVVDRRGDHLAWFFDASYRPDEGRYAHYRFTTPQPVGAGGGESRGPRHAHAGATRLRRRRGAAPDPHESGARRISPPGCDDEMQRPHSVLLTPRIDFQIRLPPTAYSDTRLVATR